MLPKDPMILLSVVNTKLRDEYASLEALCEDLELDQNELEEELAALGFVYDREQRRFRLFQKHPGIFPERSHLRPGLFDPGVQPFRALLQIVQTGFDAFHPGIHGSHGVDDFIRFPVPVPKTPKQQCCHHYCNEDDHDGQCHSG